MPSLLLDGTALSITPTSGDGTTFSFAWDTTATTEGSHQLTASATDSRGGAGTSTPVTVVVDRTPPTTFMITPNPDPTVPPEFVQGTLAASAHADDANGIASVQFTIDGHDVGTPLTNPDTAGQFAYSESLPLTGLADGPHTVSTLVTDDDGLTATAPPVTFDIGTGPLTASITSPPNFGFARSSVTVSTSASGGVGPYQFQLEVDGAPVGTAGPASPVWNTTTDVDGTHLVQVQVTDSVGTIFLTPAVNATVDNTPPVAFMTSPPPNDRDNGPTQFQVNASDAFGMQQGTVQFTVDGAPVGALLTAPDSAGSQLYSLTFDTSTLAAGTHSVGATVTDGAGNVAAATPVTIKTGTISYLPVMNYHGIDATPPDEYEITPANADAQLAYLKDNGYQTVTLAQYQQWLEGQDIGIAKPVLLTMDDGLSDDVPWTALLQKYGFTAVLFVVTGFADNTTPGDTGSQNLTWAQLQTMAATGVWEFAFHAGALGHGDSYDKGSKADGFAYSTDCPYFYSCLGIGEDIATYEANVSAEVTAGLAELQSNLPDVSTLAWAAPFNDAGQWTNLYNDPSNAVEGWMPQFFATQFPIVFTQTSPIQFGQATGLVGGLTDFDREYRFEVHSDMTVGDIASALTAPEFAR